MAPTSPGPDPLQSLSDDMIALLRTAVPVLWGFVASWLATLGIPGTVLAAVHGVAITGLTAVLAIVWYALWRWASPHVPAWVVAIVLGYAANPTYGPVPSAQQPGTPPSTGSQVPAPRTE